MIRLFREVIKISSKNRVNFYYYMWIVLFMYSYYKLCKILLVVILCAWFKILIAIMTKSVHINRYGIIDSIVAQYLNISDLSNVVEKIKITLKFFIVNNLLGFSIILFVLWIKLFEMLKNNYNLNNLRNKRISVYTEWVLESWVDFKIDNFNMPNKITSKKYKTTYH